jgi:hypothetical protein
MYELREDPRSAAAYARWFQRHGIDCTYLLGFIGKKGDMPIETAGAALPTEVAGESDFPDDFDQFIQRKSLERGSLFL